MPRPLEVIQLREFLLEEFRDLLPLGETGNEEQKTRDFLSRAIAAFAIHKESGCSIEDASNSITDGGGDNGIDAIYFDENISTLWLVQSKYIHSGEGEPALTDVAEYVDGIELLLKGDYDAFDRNELMLARRSEIENAFRQSGLKVIGLLVYSGLSLVSENRTRKFEGLKTNYNNEDEYLEFKPINLTTLHGWIADFDHTPGVNKIEFEILKPGWLRTPIEMVYGALKLQDLVVAYTTYGEAMVAGNIRKFKGDTEVNDAIMESIEDDPEDFIYLNNGITAYCERLEVSHTDRANLEKKDITAFGFSIINGAQTLGSILKADPDPRNKGFVFIRIISLERVMDEREFARKITVSTNYQNQVKPRDFAAAEPQQERIALSLNPSGINYHYRQENGRWPRPDDQNFHCDESITAASCLKGFNEEVCAKIIGKRQGLWDMEDGDLDLEIPSTYHSIFHSELAPRTLWRAVQIQRIVIETMQNAGASEFMSRKKFFENARWLILSVLTIKLRIAEREDLVLTEAEKSEVRDKCQQYSEKLWGVCLEKGIVTIEDQVSPAQYRTSRHFRSVFSDSNDCRRLFDGLMAKIN